MIKYGISGKYFLEVLDATGEVVKTAGFNNLILDNLLARWASVPSNFNSGPRFCAGTGTTAVDPAQTALVNFLAGSGSTAAAIRTNFNPTDIGNGKWRTSSTYVHTYNPSQIIGNISEIGAYWTGGSTSSIDTRALIPGGLTLLAGEQLRVTYTVYMDITSAPIPAAVNISGSWYGYTLEKLLLNSALSWRTFCDWSGGDVGPFATACYVFNAGTLHGDVTTTPSITGAVAAGISWAGQTVALGTRRVTFTMGISSGNVAGGINRILLGAASSQGYYSIGIQFDTPILKTASKSLTLAFDVALSRV